MVARFGGTILAVTHVGQAETYRIGTAQGTDLTVPGLTCFPLVANGNVRVPVGVHAVERGAWTELTFGALTIHVTRTQPPSAPIARPRVDRRTPVFLAVSLLAHLTLWLIAIAYAPFEQLPKPKQQLRLARVTASLSAEPPKPTPKPLAKPAPAKPSGVAAPAPMRMKRDEVTGAPERTFKSAAEATASLAASFDKIDIAGKMADLRPEDTYREDEANARGFGGSRGHFDPSQREGFESVETGRYATMIYDVKLCPKKSCTVVGPIPALYVRTHLHAHMDEIYACYSQFASGPGTIVLEFTITPDGAVRDSKGSGLGETGACAARVVGEIYFKALGIDYDPPRSTRVRYPVRFQASVSSS